MSKKKKSIITTVILIILVGCLGLQESVNAGSQLIVYAVGGNIEEYITGSGTYFNGSHCCYQDNRGNVVYCVQAGRKGAAAGGTGGYTEGTAIVNQSSDIVDALQTIMYRGYPANYRSYAVSGHWGKEIYQSGMLINGKFYECTPEEARAATAFAIHRQMIAIQQKYPDSTSGNEVTVKDYHNGSKAEHDVVGIADALVDYAGIDTPQIKLNYGKINSDGNYVSSNTPVYYKEVREGTEYQTVYFIVSTSNCSMTDAYIEMEEEGMGDAFVSDIFSIGIFQRIVKVSFSKDGEQSDFHLVARADTPDYGHAEIYGNPSYQDIIISGVGDQSYTNQISVKTGNRTGSIRIVKKDADTGTLLPGVRFALYKDSAMSELYTELVTDESGTAECKDIPVGVYYLKELKACKGYKIQSDQIQIQVKAGTVTSKELVNEAAYYSFSVVKRDQTSSDGMPQGNGELAGAVYGLYANEDMKGYGIYEGQQFKKDEMLARTVIEYRDGEYKGSFSQLMAGEYYVKELSAGKGYLADQTVYPVDIPDSGGEFGIRDLKVDETVMKQAFQLQKLSVNKDGEDVPLEHAGFTAWLLSDVKIQQDGTYDFTGAEPVVITADGGQELFTDENGYACSAELPYGIYIVQETTVPEDYLPVAPFIVNITEDRREPQSWRVFYDELFKAELVIHKTDKTTGEMLHIPGFGFRLYDRQNESYIGDIYYSDETGTVRIPEPLLPGDYKVEEVVIPDGINYVMNDEGYEFSIHADGIYEEGTDTLPVYHLYFENEPVAGSIEIIKQGEGELLPGVEFRLYDSEKNEISGTFRTDENGICRIDGLSLGTYYIEETETKEGYVLDTSPIEVRLAYRDAHTAAVCERIEIVNHKTAIDIKKVSSVTGKPVIGAELTVTDREGTLLDSWISDNEPHSIRGLKRGETYILSETEVPNGYRISDPVIFTVQNTEEVQEIVMQDDVISGRFSIRKTGDKLFRSEPVMKEGKITDTKLYYRTEGLAGTVFQLYAACENAVYQKDALAATLTTDADGRAEIRNIPIGRYYLIETETDGQYLLNQNPVYIEITENEVTADESCYIEDGCLILKNEYRKTRLLIHKTDEETQEPLSGVMFGLYTEADIYNFKGELILAADTLLETLMTDEEGYAESAGQYPYGNYYIKELKEKPGYRFDETRIPFAFSRDCENKVRIEVNNQKLKGEVSDTKDSLQRSNGKIRTGDSVMLYPTVIAALLSAAGMMFLIYRKYRK